MGTQDILRIVTTKGKSASITTHGLKQIGNGNMDEGLRVIGNFFFNQGMQKGRRIKFAELGATAFTAIVGRDLIGQAIKYFRDKKELGEEAERIVDVLQSAEESGEEVTIEIIE